MRCDGWGFCAVIEYVRMRIETIGFMAGYESFGNEGNGGRWTVSVSSTFTDDPATLQEWGWVATAEQVSVWAMAAICESAAVAS